MGLFDFLFNPDITRSWTPEDDLRLRFNFDDCSLNGARLGDRADLLSGLGPAEDPLAARRGCLRYFSAGLEIETSRELIDGFTLSWSEMVDPRYLPFEGTCIRHGRELPLHEEMTFVDFIREFGEPDERDDNGGVLLLYTIGRAVVEVEFDDLDLLATIVIGPNET